VVLLVVLLLYSDGILIVSSGDRDVSDLGSKANICFDCIVSVLVLQCCIVRSQWAFY